MPDSVPKIHPCALKITWEAPLQYKITYRHTMVEGKCKVCGETVEQMKEMGAEISVVPIN